MRAKKISFVIILTLVTVFSFCAVNSWAGEYTCTVNQVGEDAYSGKVYIVLTDDGYAFENRYFRIQAESKNAHLATALTAIASNLKVKVTTSGSEWAYIYNLYLLNQ